MRMTTVQEAAAATGWSPRMLRYIEARGLVVPARSPSGYRLYGPAELQRLRTLRELLETSGLELGDVGLALRLRREPALAASLDAWFEAEPRRPATLPDLHDRPVSDGDWLRFEQDKHQHLLETRS